MVWLQLQERYDTLAEFDPASGSLQEIKRQALGENEPTIEHGFFSQLGDLFMAVYGIAGKLFLVFDKRVIEIHADETIDVSGPRSARVLRVVEV